MTAMGINIRIKGAAGEREIIEALNTILAELHENKPFPTVQRNQNQSAVGGADLINTFQLVIEVKRQEQLAVETWWKQCVTSANRIPGGTPVLVYRQNRQPWRVVMFTQLPVEFVPATATAPATSTPTSTSTPTPTPTSTFLTVRSMISWVDFLFWFRHYAQKQLSA